jgi:hypothetical protein
MDESDILGYLQEFIAQKGLWDDFIEFMDKKGYDKDEVLELLD